MPATECAAPIAGNTAGMEGKYMQNINIGKSGIQVPFLGMGTWAIGGGSWWGDNWREDVPLLQVRERMAL